MDQLVQWVQLIGIPLAAIGIFLNTRSANHTRNLQITLSVVDNFSSKWEQSWRRVVRDTISTLKSSPDATLEKEQLDKVFDVLNYVDWIGRMIKDGHFKQPKTVYLSIGPRIKPLISVMRPVIDEHIRTQGAEIWGGLTHFDKKI